MTPVPLTLPLRPAEATELASLIFDLAEKRPLTDDIRNRIAARLVPLRLETLTPHMGSLARDPVHHSSYYVVVDVEEGPPQLLHMALSTAPTSSVFHRPLLIGRVRRANGPEVVINATPFPLADREVLEKFVSRVDSALLPRPLGVRGGIIAVPTEPETGMAAAFEGFRKILKRRGKNLAAIEMVTPAYEAGLYAAVRAGWRDGYSAGVTVRGEESSKEAIRDAARFTRFRIDTAALVVEEAASEERFEAGFTAEERGWISGEFVRPLEVGGSVYQLTAEEATCMAVRLGPALKACDRLHEWIREARSAMKAGKSFDFELALPRVSAKELVFCLHWLKAREHTAQAVAPGLTGAAELETTLREFAVIARHYGCLLTMDSGEGHTDAALEAIARATLGRLYYRVIEGAGETGEFTQTLSRIADVLLG